MNIDIIIFILGLIIGVALIFVGLDKIGDWEEVLGAGLIIVGIVIIIGTGYFHVDEKEKRELNNKIQTISKIENYLENTEEYTREGSTKEEFDIIKIIKDNKVGLEFEIRKEKKDNRQMYYIIFNSNKVDNLEVERDLE